MGQRSAPLHHKSGTENLAEDEPYICRLNLWLSKTQLQRKMRDEVMQWQKSFNRAGVDP